MDSVKSWDPQTEMEDCRERIFLVVTNRNSACIPVCNFILPSSEVIISYRSISWKGAENTGKVHIENDTKTFTSERLKKPLPHWSRRKEMNR